MQIYNYGEFDWNRAIAPHGNMAGIEPQIAADACDVFGVPWWTSSWPYSGGILAFCIDDKIWNQIIKIAKGS